MVISCAWDVSSSVILVRLADRFANAALISRNIKSNLWFDCFTALDPPVLLEQEVAETTNRKINT
jgi:hypothetical protein